MKKNNLKKFVIKKYIFAKNARQAIALEKKSSADDVWVDEEWSKANPQSCSSPIGFNIKKNG